MTSCSGSDLEENKAQNSWSCIHCLTGIVARAGAAVGEALQLLG